MKRISLLMALILLSLWAFTQNRTITGKITSNGVPVEGASIQIKGTNIGVAANEQGEFTLSAQKGDVLVISALNFTPREIRLGNETSLSIELQSLQQEIDEVIVTAQGIRRKAREIPYSYASLSNDEVTVGRSPALGQALSGKVSGLTIYNVNNSVDPQVKVVLRGYRSLTGNNEALLVIDGMPTTQTSLALINPNDIESITVLKGGQAATLYGSDGVNGAIIVTTKKGSKGKIKVNYSTALNFEQISFLPEFQDKYGSGSHYADSYGTSNYKPNYLDRMHDNWRPYENQQYGDPYNGEMRVVGRVLEDSSFLLLPYSPIDGARRDAFDVGFTYNNQVSFQGGDEKGTFFMSFENNRTHGIVPNDKSTRTGVHLGATRTEGKFNAAFSVAYFKADYNRTTSDFYYNVLNTAAHIPLKDLSDWQQNKFANPNGYYNDYYPNPYFTADNNRQIYGDNNIQGTMEVTYKLFPWVSIYDRLGAMSNSRARKEYTGKFTYSQWAKNNAYVPAPWDWANDYDGINLALTDILGRVYDASTNENVVNNEFQLQFAKDFKDVTNKLITGFSIYQRKTKFQEIGSSSIVVPDIYNVGNRLGDLTGSEQNTIIRKYAYYADLTSGYKNYLYLNASFRYDASSKFYYAGRPSDLWGYTSYGAALSFILTDAFPTITSDVLSFAKLRAGFNKNTNDNLDPHLLTNVFPNGLGFPYGSVAGLTVGDVMPDSSLKPETIYSYEVGTELQFFKSRVSVDFTAYLQNSNDQILTVDISNASGSPFLRANVADSKNWGYEAEVRVQILRNTNFKWNVSARYSYNDNKIEELYGNADQFQYGTTNGGGGGYSYAGSYMIKDLRYPYLKATAYVRDPATGMVLVDPNTGYPILDQATLKNFGGVLPRHNAGFGSNLQWKNFEMAFNLEYRGGNYIFHQLGRDMTFTGAGKWTEDRAPHIFPNSAYDDGTGKIVPNTTVNTREAEYALWVDYYRLIAENFVTPGWFIKLRDVNISYNFSPELLRKTKVISAATLSIYGRNLFTIVDGSNHYTDPEFSYTTGNGIGINNTLQTPPVRQYGINLNLTF